RLVQPADRSAARADPDVAVRVDQPGQHEAAGGDRLGTRDGAEADPVADQPQVADLVVGQQYAADVQGHYFSSRFGGLEKSNLGSLNPGGSPAFGSKPGGSWGIPAGGRPGTRGRPPPPPLPLRLFFGDLVALRRPASPIMPPICFIIFCASTKRLSSWLTSVTVTPEPFAMRTRRDPLMIFGLVRSPGVMDRMIAVIRSKCL